MTDVDHRVCWGAVQTALDSSKDHGVVDAEEANELVIRPDPILRIRMVCKSDIVLVREKENVWVQKKCWVYAVTVHGRTQEAFEEGKHLFMLLSVPIKFSIACHSVPQLGRWYTTRPHARYIHGPNDFRLFLSRLVTSRRDYIADSPEVYAYRMQTREIARRRDTERYVLDSSKKRLLSTRPMLSEEIRQIITANNWYLCVDA
jgi:hypothetical protein